MTCSNSFDQRGILCKCSTVTRSHARKILRIISRKRKKKCAKGKKCHCNEFQINKRKKKRLRSIYVVRLKRKIKQKNKKEKDYKNSADSRQLICPHTGSSYTHSI